MFTFRRTYQSLNRIEIDTKALKQNFHYVQNAHPEALVAPVLKSNAYGHGLQLVGKWASEELRPPFLCVDSLFEAYALEKSGVKTPILILGYTFPQNFSIRRKLTHFHFPVYDLETLEMLNKHQPGANIHIKIDTGMHRLGILPNQVEDFIKALQQNKRLRVVGIYSHLSQADNPKKPSFTQQQIRTFKQVIRQFEKAGYAFAWKHISASAGALPTLMPSNKANPNCVTDPEFNLIRLGLSFYGYSPFDYSVSKNVARRSSPEPKHRTSNSEPLQPALTLKTHIVQIKTIGQGSEIGYGGSFKAKKRMCIAILPIGYYDGMSRQLSNQGQVSLNGVLCDIVGRISMNMTMIDVSNIPTAKVGDQVMVISNQSQSPHNAHGIAGACKGISYEVLTNLSETTKRVLL
jgi:alanine racemase